MLAPPPHIGERCLALDAAQPRLHTDRERGEGRLTALRGEHALARSRRDYPIGHEPLDSVWAYRALLCHSGGQIWGVASSI